MTLLRSEIKRRHEPVLSLDQFSRLERKYLAHIAEAEHSLRLACLPFQEGENIRPVHCKKVIHSLEETNERVQEFCKLLNETLRLPIVLTALRYRLLFTLHLVEEQLCKLIDLLDNYRAICMTSSSHEPRLRNEIYDSFEKLLELTSEIPQQAQFLNDEARFQQQRLMSNVEA